MQISPLAPSLYPELPPINGVRLAVAACGVRYANRTDLLLAEFTENTTVAGVFTQSLTASAPVLACREALKSGTARGLAVNSGNSNAFTGKAGVAAVESIVSATATLFSCAKNAIFTASTGVIGEIIPHEKITNALPEIAAKLSESSWESAARAIMTTDTYPKMASKNASIGGITVTINGIAKGSGMIAPDMATMLAFVFTDAKIPAHILQEMLTNATESTFNSITVDSYTSTKILNLAC